MTQTESAAGPRIRAAREAAGISLRSLAARLEVSPGTLSAIEREQTSVTVERLTLIAAELGMSPADLLTDALAGASNRAGDRSGPLPHPAEPSAATPVASSAANPAAPGSWRHFAPTGHDPATAAAVAVFNELGYHAATMRLIAGRAGLSAPGLYHHVGSKQELLVRILDDTMADLTWRVLAARDEGATVTERISLIVEALALYHTHRREPALIGASEMRSLEPPNRTRIAGLRSQVQHLLDDQITEALADGVAAPPPPGLTAAEHAKSSGRAIATMCQAMPQWFDPAGPHTPEQLAAQYAAYARNLLGLPES